MLSTKSEHRMKRASVLCGWEGEGYLSIPEKTVAEAGGRLWTIAVPNGFIKDKCILPQFWIHWTVFGGNVAVFHKLHPKPKQFLSWKTHCNWSGLPCRINPFDNAAVKDCHKRLQTCVSADGRHFEHKTWWSYKSYWQLSWCHMDVISLFQKKFPNFVINLTELLKLRGGGYYSSNDAVLTYGMI